MSARVLDRCEIFQVEGVSETGEAILVFLSCPVGSTFTDVWVAVPDLKRSISGLVDVVSILQMSTIHETRTL